MLKSSIGSIAQVCLYIYTFSQEKWVWDAFPFVDFAGGNVRGDDCKSSDVFLGTLWRLGLYAR